MSTEADRTSLSAFADAIRSAEYVTFKTHKREDGAHILGKTVRLTEARTEALRQALAAWERREGSAP